MGIIAGGFAKFGFKGPDGVEIRDLQIPAFALLVHTPAADQALEGFQDLLPWLFRSSMRSIETVRSHSDLSSTSKTSTASPRGLREPVARNRRVRASFRAARGALIFLDLVRPDEEDARHFDGQAADHRTTPTHIAMKELLPVGAAQASFVDGAAFSRNLRPWADGIFEFVERTASRSASKIAI